MPCSLWWWQIRNVLGLVSVPVSCQRRGLEGFLQNGWTPSQQSPPGFDLGSALNSEARSRRRRGVGGVRKKENMGCSRLNLDSNPFF